VAGTVVGADLICAPLFIILMRYWLACVCGLVPLLLNLFCWPVVVVACKSCFYDWAFEMWLVGL
jgi:hypothetical protein